MGSYYNTEHHFCLTPTDDPYGVPTVTLDVEDCSDGECHLPHISCTTSMAGTWLDTLNAVQRAMVDQ